MSDNTDKSVIYKQRLIELQSKYYNLLEGIKIRSAGLDYSKLNHYKQLLSYLDSFENNAYEIFDLLSKEHVFFSSKFLGILGYDLENMHTYDAEELFDSKIHPDDYLKMTEIGVYFIEMMLKAGIEDIRNSKLFFDFRMLNVNNEYIRVIKQHKILEFDEKGNPWLTMGIINVSPEKNLDLPVKARLVNTLTGETFYFPDNIPEKAKKHPLSERELKVLELVSNGYSSKEISEKLFIATNTVNTHRQRIIEKLGVRNTTEALKVLQEM